MKLPNIQILRAVAALAVVFYHTGIETSELCKASGWECKLGDWLGALGVSLFFIISGFIMVVTSWNHFGKAGASKEFMKRRLYRIAPLYWVLTTATLCGILVAPWIFNAPMLRFDYLAGSYLFWPVMRDDGLIRPVMKLGWTLNYEMFFYLVFAAALLFRRWAGLAFAVFVLIAMMTLRATGVFAGSATALQFWSDPIVLNFVIGIAAGIFYMKGLRIKARASLFLCLVAITGIFAVEMNSVALRGISEDSFVSRLIVAGPMAVLFLAASFGRQLTSSSVWMRSALLLGDASYSLYLVHPFALRGTRAMWLKLVGADASVGLFYVLCATLAVVAGVMCYLVIERPVARFFARLDKAKDHLPQPTVQVSAT